MRNTAYAKNTNFSYGSLAIVYRRGLLSNVCPLIPYFAVLYKTPEMGGIWICCLLHPLIPGQDQVRFSSSHLIKFDFSLWLLFMESLGPSRHLCLFTRQLFLESWGAPPFHEARWFPLVLPPTEMDLNTCCSNIYLKTFVLSAYWIICCSITSSSFFGVSSQLIYSSKS